MDPSVFNFSDPGCFLFPAHNTEYSSQMCEHSFQRLVKHILREYQWKQPNNMTHDFDEGQDLGQDMTSVRTRPWCVSSTIHTRERKANCSLAQKNRFWSWALHEHTSTENKRTICHYSWLFSIAIRPATINRIIGNDYIIADNDHLYWLENQLIVNCGLPNVIHNTRMSTF